MKRYLKIAQTTYNNKLSYQTVDYPQVAPAAEDTYVITTIGDRYDILAQQYYNDSTLWWIIALANPTQAQDSYAIAPGQQIRIPNNPQQIVTQFNGLNE
jgi:nucleoid-associated protein YgaU